MPISDVVLQVERPMEGAPAKIVLVTHESHTKETETVVYVPDASSGGPDADQLAALREVDASFPDRVMTQWEKQLDHDRHVDRVRVYGRLAIRGLGLVSAFVLCFTTIRVGAQLIEKGRDATGIAVIVGALGTLAAVFVVGKLLGKSGPPSGESEPSGGAE